MTRRDQLIAAARSDLGQPAPQNTCVSRGAYPWATRAGLPYPQHSDGNGYSTANVSDLVDAARLGLDGWRLVPVDQAKPGDYLVWGADQFHISLYVDDVNGGKRSIGAGGPSGKVAYQPTGGGGNRDSVFSVALRPPFEDDAAAPAPAPAPAVEDVKDQVRRIARYLNGRSVDAGWGVTSSADQDGIPTNPGSDVSNYYWLVQRAGRADGLYGDDYLIDGIPGPRTYWLEGHYAGVA